MASTLAFVDDPARLAEVPSGATVVALDPLVAIAAGAGAVDFDAYVDERELESLGDRTFERVEAICATLDAAVGSGAASWHFQQLKFLYDGLLVRALGAIRLAEATGAREALVLARDGSLAAAVVPAMLRERAVVVTAAAPAIEPPPPPKPPTLRQRLASARVRARHAARRARPRVLCLDEAYSLPAIAAALRERGADPLLWLPPPPTPRAAGPLPPGVPALFRLDGLDLWPAAEARVRSLVAHDLARDDGLLRAAHAAVRRERPDAILGSTFAAPPAKAAATAARAAGVPSIVSRHGELGTQLLPVMAFNDLDVVDWALCWGAWEAAYVERHALRPVGPLVVGAPMIEDAVTAAPSRAEIRRRVGVAEDALVVLLATNALEGDAWFAGRRAPVDTRHVRHQIAVAEQLLALPGVTVAIKEHPQWRDGGPLAAWVAATRSPAVVVRESSFVEVLHLGDVAVLDFPATTLAQALHGSAPLVVVDHPVLEWEPGVREHFERHGIGLVPPGLVGAAVRERLEARRSSVGPTYPQEAREPVTASGRGTAAERAADALLQIAGG
jgi:hypothetical protein